MSMRKSAPQSRPLTVDDLEQMPDDGRRYELVDGRLEVTPAPLYPHTVIADRLLLVLHPQTPRGHNVSAAAGINFNADRTHHRIPDLCVIPRADRSAAHLTRPPLLAVEIVSRSTVFTDHHTKRAEYAKFGIESYWIIDPNLEEIGIMELRLDGDQYRTANQAFGRELFQTDAPFPYRLVPHWLLADCDDWEDHVLGGEPGR
ncbi:Uma2 family endonuclease [Streptomonospora nanhaiensis]|uniref:Uma2 family endonuclease n=2 Tax=Streptomonospora nanhaiensis TaxID=1323731 RepID=A0A853BJK9_9ACTN|nr:Uma2 family endonuclease [Streptomonospora nanhaiensis]NYI94884.1 Uma2 family endonuclease [Streptomonospora nanhaiensis]